jgi:arylformamidase
MSQTTEARMLDITLRLSERTLVYPGDPAPVLTRVLDIARGDPLTARHLSVGCHVGTHVDAPAHFLAGGATLDRLPLQRFHGPAVVADLTGVRVVLPEHVAPLRLPQAHHVLLRTDNAPLLALERFTEEYCHVSEAAAELLCALQPLSVGFDYYSLDPYGSESFPAHTALARAGVPVYVCLDLAAVPPGRYTFTGLPLRLEEAEGSPVRALLLPP